MMIYIPAELYEDKSNRKKIDEILGEVPDTSVVWDGKKTKEDAAREIDGLGEKRVAEWVRGWQS